MAAIDANSYNDSFPVKYSQMVGIYTGDKVENVGSFVVFLQSPAGWLCIIFVIFMTFFIPLVDDKIQEEKDKRYRLITGDFTAYNNYKSFIKRIILKRKKNK